MGERAQLCTSKCQIIKLMGTRGQNRVTLDIGPPVATHLKTFWMYCVLAKSTDCSTTEKLHISRRGTAFCQLKLTKLRIPNPSWICHPLTKLNIPPETKDQPSYPGYQATYIWANCKFCTLHMRTHANCMAGLALEPLKPCLLGVRPDPPHITMEMALHCGDEN